MHAAVSSEDTTAYVISLHPYPGNREDVAPGDRQLGNIVNDKLLHINCSMAENSQVEFLKESKPYHAESIPRHCEILSLLRRQAMQI